MAKPRKEVSAGQKREITTQYQAGAGMLTLADKYGHCVSVIRKVLVEAQLEIRGRGRPTKP
jgi:hypothetical protein